MKMFLVYTLLAVLLSFKSPPSVHFKFIHVGLTEYATLDLSVHTKETIYQKALHWTKEMYLNQEKKILAEIENEKIRFKIFQSKAIRLKNQVLYDAIYKIELTIKDGKVKFDPIAISYLVKEDTTQKIYNINLAANSSYFDKGGNAKYRYEAMTKSVASIFNDIFKDFSSYLLSEKTDW